MSRFITPAPSPRPPKRVHPTYHYWHRVAGETWQVIRSEVRSQARLVSAAALLALFGPIGVRVFLANPAQKTFADKLTTDLGENLLISAALGFVILLMVVIPAMVRAPVQLEAKLRAEHLKEVEELRVRSAKPTPAPLQLRHEQREPYLVARWPERPPDMHYIGIYNPPGNPAITRVLVEIQGMDPLATDFHGRGSPEFPAAVPRKTGGDPRTGLTLNPDTEELWEIATAYPDGQGEGNFFVQGIALPAWPFGRNEMLVFKRGDRWRLHFQVSADGLASQSFDVLMEDIGDAIRCHVEGVTP